MDGINADAGLPISVDASLDGDGTGGLLNLGGDGIDLALLGIDGDTDALINVGLEDGQGGATADVGSLINAAVLDLGGTGGIEVLAHSDVYDGNVPLVGDLSSALGATLDHLTTSSSLFDVPALDILCIDGLDT